MSQNNLKRVFADVVSIDAWHTPFDGRTGVAALHVDAVFNTARLGGEIASPIRFRLSLKRAELVAILGANEPLEVLRDSVARDQTISSVAISNSQSSTSSAQFKVGAVVNTAAPYIAAMSADGGLGMSSQKSSFAKIEQETPLVLVSQSQTADGHYRWELRPALGSILTGRGWNAQRDPRLKVKDKRANKNHLVGALRIEVRCKREDFLIEDIEVKDETLLTKLRNATSLRNKMVAVEAYLRNVLVTESLYFGDISDPFGDIQLADLMVGEGCYELAANS